MRPELIIFDFDGTLADSFPSFVEAFRSATQTFGLREVQDEEMERLRHLGAREIIQIMQIPFWKVPMIGRFVHTAMANDRAGISLFPEIEDTLRALAQAGIAIAVVSSNSEENVRRILGPSLSAVICAYECGAGLFGKHSRFKRVVRRMNVDLEDVLSVGDEIRDVEASAKAGIAFGAVCWGYTHPDALIRRGARYLFRSPPEILQFARGEFTGAPAAMPI